MTNTMTLNAEPNELKNLANEMLSLSANSLNAAVDQFGRLYGSNAAMIYKGLSNVKAGLITGVFAIDPNAGLATNAGRVAGAIAFDGF